MLVIYLYTLIAASAEEVCPIFVCDEWVSSACLYRYENIAVYSPCADPDSYCPDFSYSLNQTVYCQQGKDEVSADLSCINYAGLNKNCTAKPCSPGLYCSEGMCQSPPAYNRARCNETCGTGYVCNFNRCIAYFSLPAGKDSSNSLACASGILKNGTCAEMEISKTLPQICKNDEDCSSVNNKSVSKCVCIKEEMPRKMCTLHRSDPLIIEVKKAISDGDIAKSKYLMYKAMNYPVLEYSTKCHEKDSIELKTLNQLKKQIEKCFGHMLSISLGVALVFL